MVDTKPREQEAEKALVKKLNLPVFSKNILTNIILMYGLHEFGMYTAFSRVSKRFRSAIKFCLPYQKHLLDKGRVSDEMHELMMLDDIY